MTIFYDKPLVLKVEKGHGGYIYFIDHLHPLRNAVGRVYLHRHVASITCGRWLLSNEHVHHVDGNKANNDPGNLVVLTSSEHTKLHRPVAQIFKKECAYCGTPFNTCREEAVTCSDICRSSNRRKFEINKIELEKLVWAVSSLQLAKLYGVSDKAIAKRCKALGIKKPPRGYWAKNARICPLPTEEVKG